MPKRHHHHHAPRQPAEPQMLGSPPPQPPSQDAAVPAGHPDPQADGRRPAGGLLYRPWVQDVLPFVTSLVAHAAVIALLVLTIKVVETVARVDPPKSEEQVNNSVSQSPADLTKPVGGVPFQGSSEMPFEPPKSERPEVAASEAFSARSPSDINAAAGDAMDRADPGTQLIGRGPARLLSGKTGGPGSDPYDSGGPGTAVARGFNRTGGAKGPKNVVFGYGGTARRIVFICDATGTMISKLPVLKQELIKTVAELSTGVQSYNIVFFTDGGKVLAADAAGLLVSNQDNKRKTYQWLDDVSPVGTTDPIPAIERAFAMQPDLVYFLSDGEFNNIKTYEQVIAAVNRANAGKRARVNTILFDTRDPEAEKAMDAIATQNGGKYSFVKEEDINRDGGR